MEGEAGNGVGNPIGGIGFYTKQVTGKTVGVGGKGKGVAVAVGGQGHCSGSVEGLLNIVAEAENLIILNNVYRLHGERTVCQRFDSKNICTKYRRYHCAYHDEQSGSRSHLFHSIFTEDCKGNAGSENYCADKEKKPSETHKGKGEAQRKAGRKTGD